MLSRVAERFYWMARNIERAENTARLLNAYNLLMLDLPRGVGLSWSQLVDISGSQDIFASRYRRASERNVLGFILSERDNPGSIITCVSMARENVRTTRDIMPSEGFEQVNELLLFVRRRLASRNANKNVYNFLAEVVQRCQGITGLLAGTMSHDAAYQFVRLGRNLERADMTTRVLDVGAGALMASSGPDGRPPADRSPYEDVRWLGYEWGDHLYFASDYFDRLYDVLLKATKVDGVYDSDPVKNEDAKRFDTVSFDQVLADKLSVMDATAIVMCRDNDLPLRVFDLHRPGALVRAIAGENVGTVVTA